MHGPRFLRVATTAVALITGVALTLLPRGPVEGAAAGRGGASSGAGAGAGAQLAVQIKIVQIKATGSGGPKDIDPNLKPLRSTLARFNYRKFAPIDEHTYTDRASHTLANGDELKVKVRLVQGDQIHLRVEITRGLKQIMGTNVTVRKDKWAMIGGDMGSSGEGLFVALSASF